MIEENFRNIIKSIAAEDPKRSGLQRTPQRAAKAFEFFVQGYDENIHDLINGALFDTTSSEMVVVKDIEFYSLCEHHLLPFFGTCHVGYIPNRKMIGFSKIPRIVNHIARRLQVQENMTDQIARLLREVTGATGVGVIVEAQHLCSMMRGVEKQRAKMITSSMIGAFEQDSVQQKFQFLLR